MEDPDFNRPSEEFRDFRDETRQMYKDCCDATEVFEATNPLRTSIFLNYSVFLYEICEAVEDARFIANRAYNAALVHFEKLGEDHQQAALPIMQALRDNYEIWGMDVLTER